MSAATLIQPHGSIAVRSESLDAVVVRDDATALRQWRQLDQRLNNTSLTCSFDWVDCWIRFYGDLPHEFLLLRKQDETVGIALLVHSRRRQGPFVDRRVHFGTAGEPEGHGVCVEYHRPLVDPDHFDTFFRLLFQHIDRDRQWDTLHLDGIDGRLFPAIEALRPNPIVRRIPCHYFNLQETRDAGQDVLTRLGSSTRRNVKQNLKQFPGITLEWSETLDQANEMFADLVRLHQERWQNAGHPGCFSSDRFTEFHRSLVQRWQPKGRLVLTRVKAGDLLLGCVHIFVERNRLLFYQCGSARLGPKLSPGVITDYLTMQAGLERGYDAYDFMAGDTVHKRKLSTHANDLVWLAWRRPRLKFKAMNLLKSLKRWLKPAGAAPAAVAESDQ